MAEARIIIILGAIAHLIYNLIKIKKGDNVDERKHSVFILTIAVILWTINYFLRK